MTRTKKKIFLTSLGCAKNLVDSENILGLIASANYPVVSDINTADIVIINTCGFIQSAVEESIDTILAAVERKESGDLEKIFVTGCFVQRYGYKLTREIPEVDGWLGTGEITRIIELIGSAEDNETPFFIRKPGFLADHGTPRIQTTPFYSSYLKIAEGCSHKCSYCGIPAIRGPLRSRGIDSLVSEAKDMRDRGVKEVNLIAQDTTVYGADLNNDVTIERLLEELLLIEGIEWIRLLYSHPYEVSNALLGLMENEGRIAPYLDIPFQHVNSHILKLMGREIKKETPGEFIERVRSIKRSLSLRTTMMVGFPDETDEMFTELINFIKDVEFDNLGTFIYSPEPGTAAARLKNVPDLSTAEHRRNEIMKLQADISLKKNRDMVGRTVPVLIEGVSSETDLLLAGRTSKMAPDVDGRVLINKGNGMVGEILKVKITEAHTYDLVGESIQEI
ncbi:30S ribosomal protein S12 methylthiotransferase RimO [Thermodesulfobacteriota bacterium]